MSTQAGDVRVGVDIGGTFTDLVVSEDGVLNIHKLFWRQINVLGSTMGNEQDFRAMVALVAAGKLRPIIDQVYPLAAAEQAHARMEQSAHMGKIILAIAD